MCNFRLGFTLIEVLIALVVLSIALTAIIMAISTNSRSMFYLTNKTAADWVALNAITEIQLGLIKLNPGQSLHGQANMLNSSLNWEASLKPTIHPFVSQIDVMVSRQGATLIHMIGYINNDI